MSRLSLTFFAVAATLGAGGMVWGIVMGISEDFTLAPAHAHFNLLGWASLALMGAFYGLAGKAAPRTLGWANFVASTLGALLFPPGLALYLSGQGSALSRAAVASGSILALLGMLFFLSAVINCLRRASGRIAD